MAVCINHAWTNKLTRLKPHYNCITISFLAQNTDCVVTSRGNRSEVSYFAGGGGDDTEMIATDSESAGSGSVDEGAEDDEFWRRPKRELRGHGQGVGDGAGEGR